MSETPRIVIRTKDQPVSKNRKFSFSRDSMRLPANSKYICQYREKAWEQYQNMSFPEKKDEAWRRTSTAHIQNQKFDVSIAAENANGNTSEKFLIPEFRDIDFAGQIIQSDDITTLNYQRDLNVNGVVFCDLLTAEKQHHQLLEKIMGKVVRSDESKFSALTASLSQFGMLLYIPSGVCIEDAFHYRLHGSAEQKAYLSHILVYLEDQSSATLYIEESSEPTAGGMSFSSSIFEVIVGNQANLNIIKLQNWQDNVLNISHERVKVGRDAQVNWFVGALGSQITKSFLDLDLIEQGSTGNMYGFYVPNQKQHFDYDTQQNHLAAHTTSDLMYKGALLDESRAVWQGMIYVAPIAMKTDGYQMNRNLLLSPKARVDTIPGLEILANDVRCTHGATVGKLDKEQLFYLLSRGIPFDEAERLLVDGFFEPVIQKIKQENIQDYIKNLLYKKLGYTSDN